MSHVSKVKAKLEAAKLEVKVDQAAFAKKQTEKLNKEIQDSLKSTVLEPAEDSFGRMSDVPNFDEGGLKGKAKNEGEANSMQADKGIKINDKLLEQMQKLGIDPIGLNAPDKILNQKGVKITGVNGPLCANPFILTELKGYKHGVEFGTFSVRDEKFSPIHVMEVKTMENGNKIETNLVDRDESTPGFDYASQEVKDSQGKRISYKSIDTQGNGLSSTGELDGY